jgi:hypothetical protein
LRRVSEIINRKWWQMEGWSSAIATPGIFGEALLINNK